MNAAYVTAAIIAVASVALAIRVRLLRNRPKPQLSSPETTQPITLVFQDSLLVDADDRVWSMLSASDEPQSWQVIHRLLYPMMPDLPKTLTELNRTSQDGELHVDIHRTEDCFRLTLRPTATNQIDWFKAKQTAILSKQLCDAVKHAPDLIWFTSRDGVLLWSNDAFSHYAESQNGPAAFCDHLAQILSDTDLSKPTRVKVAPADTRPDLNRWLEVTRQDTDNGCVFFATGIDGMVHAEAAQHNFVQTLSKTFANLTTGLAIFDRDRRLMLFNPALVDLSRVPITFLSARPTLFEFFDKLRECRVMPEPKSYDDWRERLAKLVAAASDDRFRETWTLASGQTFDITGQPYPDGAIAFLFNDITAEVSLTRGYRVELDTLQSVIDMIEDAVCVFDSQGILTLCNTAYATLWNTDPDAGIPETTILDATQTWKSAFHPSPLWPELRDFVTNTTERASWDTDLRRKDGRELVCRIDPICHGATLIRFCHRPQQLDTHKGSEGLQIVSA